MSHFLFEIYTLFTHTIAIYTSIEIKYHVLLLGSSLLLFTLHNLFFFISAGKCLESLCTCLVLITKIFLAVLHVITSCE